MDHSIIMLFVWLLVILAIVAIIWGVIQKIPIPESWSWVVYVIFAIGAILLLVSFVGKLGAL